MLQDIDHENGTQQEGLEMISAHKMSDHSMKRTYFPGWSHCPAEKWVRALLEGVWTLVSAGIGLQVQI